MECQHERDMVFSSFAESQVDEAPVGWPEQASLVIIGVGSATKFLRNVGVSG